MGIKHKCNIATTKTIGRGGFQCDLLVEITPLLRFKYSIFSDSKKNCMALAKKCIHEMTNCQEIKVIAEKELGVWRLEVTPSTSRRYYLLRVS